tara:strand:+ start:9089 stop:9619 length:531 start_codon:yes stop_codon:yes gene_type:complete
MKYSNKIICEPLNDSKKRFLLGKNGTSEMLAIGLNPSNANEKRLDPTSRNIEKIAKKNGCNGWWLVNLYPIRTPNPRNLPKKPNLNLAEQNFRFILEILKNPKFNVTKVLCCWGNHIDDRLYLKLQASKILEFAKEKKIVLYCLGKTKLGNPFHPSPMTVNSFLGGMDRLRISQYQ